MIIVKIIGGLGNQLFQYATGRAFSLKLSTELKLDLTFFEDPKYSSVFRLDRFNLPFTIANTFETLRVKNKDSKYISRILRKLNLRLFPYTKRCHLREEEVLSLHSNSSKLNYYLEGWFADEKYFKDYRSVIIDDLRFDEKNNINLELLEEISTTNSVSVHIRRGDYLKNSYFNILDKSYYLEAINLLITREHSPNFFFFSDDIEFVEREYRKIKKAIFVSNNSEKQSEFSTSGDIADLFLMSKCKHNIIANSTFSWWGAWLNKNPNKIVIAPQKWYNNKKAQEKYETETMIPKEWIKV